VNRNETLAGSTAYRLGLTICISKAHRIEKGLEARLARDQAPRIRGGHWRPLRCPGEVGFGAATWKGGIRKEGMLGRWHPKKGHQAYLKQNLLSEVELADARSLSALSAATVSCQDFPFTVQINMLQIHQ
jgi:hypothetical protein